MQIPLVLSKKMKESKGSEKAPLKRLCLSRTLMEESIALRRQEMECPLWREKGWRQIRPFEKQQDLLGRTKESQDQEKKCGDC